MNLFRKLALVAATLVIFAGCAARRAYQDGRSQSQSGDWDQAVYHFSKALALDPGNIEYRKSLDLAKVRASQYHLELAKSYMEGGAVDLAIVEYRVAATLDPTNRYVADSLENAVELRKELEAKPDEQSEIERLKEEASGASLVPVLQPTSDAPITLNFPPNTKVKDIYSALGKAAGINMLYDQGIRDQETFSIDIAGVSFRKALDLIAISNHHFYKPLDAKTLMLIPDNPQKRRDFEDNVIKTFYLSNASPNDVVNTLRGLLDARRIATNQALNAITIRDTPEKISVMERIIEANDKPPSEVVIDVEILEVRNSRDLFYGTNLSSYQVTQSLEQPDTVNGVSGLRFSSIPFVNASDWLLTFPSVAYRLEKNQGNIRTLARPSLRALDGKQVTLRLGDQVPIETSTFSAGVAGGAVPLTRQFQFRDIGTNIDITPRVHHNNEVTLQLQVEVTSVGQDPDGPSGPTPPTFGNRRINTEIRLKDGETNLLAGLFTSSEENSRGGVPILSDLPVLRAILGSNSRTRRETDIVLTLTPHIVRTPNIRRRDMEPFYIGTANNIGGTLSAQSEGSGGPSPFTPPAGDDDGGVVAPPQPEEVPRPTPPRPSFRPGGGNNPAPQGRLEPPFSPEPSQPSPTSVRPGLTGETAARGGAGEVGSEPAIEPQASTTPAPVSGPASVSLVPAALRLRVGEEAAVDVMLQDGTGVGHAPFWLDFDASVIEVLAVTEGDFLRADGRPTQLLSSIQETQGHVVVGLSRLGRGPGASGSGVLATIRVRGKAAGSSQLSFSHHSLRTTESVELAATFAGGGVVVTEK